MPSSHAAMMIALLTAVGAKVGVDAPTFGVVAVITTIVLYDAINVRRAVGEQAVVLQKLQGYLGKTDNFYIAKGHTLVEVIAGSIVGLAVTYSLLKISL
jgi:acid phosphatase family membrane protein YuiD